MHSSYPVTKEKFFEMVENGIASAKITPKSPDVEVTVVITEKINKDAVLTTVMTHPGGDDKDGNVIIFSQSFADKEGDELNEFVEQVRKETFAYLNALTDTYYQRDN